MPDKPTDKKLTFVEWFASEKKSDVKYSKKFIKRWVIEVLNKGHTGTCIGEWYPCNLCSFEDLLSEYHKYFKQK